MTHYPAWLFLDRCVCEVIAIIFITYHVFRFDRFRAVRTATLRKLNMKAIMTVLLLTGLPLLFVFDLASFIIKTQTGLAITHLGSPLTYPTTGIPTTAVDLPWQFWQISQEHWILPLNFLLTITLVIEFALILQQQVFWQFLSATASSGDFTRSREYKLYWAAVGTAVVLFMTIQGATANNHNLSEGLPIFVFSIIEMGLLVLCAKTHYKFRAMMRLTQRAGGGQAIMARLSYFQEMNRLMAISLSFQCIPFFMLSIDSFTTHQVLNTNQIVLGVFIKFVNLGIFLVWIFLTLIFYPRKDLTGIKDRQRNRAARDQERLAAIAVQREKSVAVNGGQDDQGDGQKEDNRSEAHMHTIDYSSSGESEKEVNSQNISETTLQRTSSNLASDFSSSDLHAQPATQGGKTGPASQQNLLSKPTPTILTSTFGQGALSPIATMGARTNAEGPETTAPAGPVSDFDRVAPFNKAMESAPGPPTNESAGPSENIGDRNSLFSVRSPNSWLRRKMTRKDNRVGSSTSIATSNTASRRQALNAMPFSLLMFEGPLGLSGDDEQGGSAPFEDDAFVYGEMRSLPEEV